jgi:hypothetical protein
MAFKDAASQYRNELMETPLGRLSQTAWQMGTCAASISTTTRWRSGRWIDRYSDDRWRPMPSRKATGLAPFGTGRFSAEVLAFIDAGCALER